jgi:dienelactone hydrolase
VTRRRRLLAALGSLAAVSVSGCSGTGEPRTETTTRATTESADGDTDAATTLTTARRQAVARRLTERLAAGEFEAVSAAFLASARDDLPPERLSQAWALQTAGKGTFRGVESVERSTSEGRPVTEVTAGFEAGRVRALWFFARGEPSGVRFRQVEATYTPPAYVDGTAFEERRLTLETPACDLGATLTVPDGADRVPGVVLVHGTGPQDRDLSVGPNRPFRDLAWGLASRGVAVLRYDKRSFVCSVARTDAVTVDDLTTDDAVTALRRLQGVGSVGWTGVLGHSQGGLLAPRIARRGDADGVGLLAAPAGPLWELVPEQVRYLTRIDGTVTDAERRRLDAVETAARRVSAGDFEPDETLLGASGTYWRSLRSYDQTAVAAGLSVPALVGHGERDYQVPPAAVDEWRVALGDRATVHTYPALDHLLLPGVGDSSPYDYARPGHVGRAVVEDLTAWLRRR